MFGPAVDVYAPGDDILSSYGNTGFDDTKYSVPGNYFYPIPGTSMASHKFVVSSLVLLLVKKDLHRQMHLVI